MSEQEMRELNRWIAEHAFGWTRFTTTGMGALVGLDLETGLPRDVPRYTAGDFAAIKCEIERRGWRWAGEWHPGRYYWFRIWKEEKTGDPLQIKVTVLGEGYMQSEELAGCFAFKSAVEATDGEGAG